MPTDLTVAAVVPKGGRYLIVEERASGVVVVTQPGGHIEANESPEDAVIRETLEETACSIEVESLLGVYLWIQPQTRQQFLRIVYVARFLSQDESLPLDDGVHAVHWYSLDDLRRRRQSLRSPVVIRCIDDYVTGNRKPQTLLSGMLPVQKNVDAVLARACLV
ncbi:MAG TPA: NUDIX domain-containing protein [Woeseiaceae bacterium]|nr:NUDIX domain-containing protein [Woeseiaceae bacterium]